MRGAQEELLGALEVHLDAGVFPYFQRARLRDNHVA